MKTAFKVVAIGIAALFISVALIERAQAGASDSTVQAVGITIQPDATGAQLVAMAGMSDAVRAQYLKAGTSSGAAQGAVNTSSVSLMVANAATLGVNSTPAVNVQASASVAAGAATVRHMAAHCAGSIATVAAQTQVNLNLRDGATGAGTIVWAGTIACALGTPCILDSGPLNIIGTAATAMTCEWSGIPAVGNFEVANLEYKNAG